MLGSDLFLVGYERVFRRAVNKEGGVMMTKVCSKCKQEKPLSEYHRYNRRNETHYSQCKQCKAEYKQANKDKLLEAQYKRRVGKQNNSPQRKAWNALYYAIKTGKVMKPDNCQVCGKLVGKKIQAHHKDYSKPFEVTWCCQDCHVILDKNRQEVAV